MFNQHAAAALAMLYAAFPSPINVHPIQLIDPDWKEGEPFDFELHRLSFFDLRR